MTMKYQFWKTIIEIGWYYRDYIKHRKHNDKLSRKYGNNKVPYRSLGEPLPRSSKGPKTLEISQKLQLELHIENIRK